MVRFPDALGIEIAPDLAENVLIAGNFKIRLDTSRA
jgi:hypothetical protein